MIMITRVLLAAVLFYVVSNPATYKLVESLLGRFFKIAMNGSTDPRWACGPHGSLCRSFLPPCAHGVGYEPQGVS